MNLGQLRYLKELGNDRYLSRYDTGSLAQRCGNTPRLMVMVSSIAAVA